MKNQFHNQSLRTAQDIPLYEHTDNTLGKLKEQEDSLRALERKMQKRLLLGDEKVSDEFVALQKELAALFGEKEEGADEVGAEKSSREVYTDIQEEIERDTYLSALFAHTKNNVKNTVWDARSIQKALAMLSERETLLQSSLFDREKGDRRTSTISERKMLDALHNAIDGCKTDMKQLKTSNEEAYYVVQLLRLRALQKQGNTGAIIEVDSVKDVTKRVTALALSGRPILLHGPPGTGKTEIAMHVAEHLPTAEAFRKDEEGKRKYEGVITGEADKTIQPFGIISASKQTDISEFTGHQVLRLKQVEERKRKEFLAYVDTEYTVWEESNKEASDIMKAAQKSIIADAYTMTQGQGMETQFWLGPMYECMEKGIPFIVDEVNAMPPEVIIKINHMMTRRPGDIVSVQEDSGKKITIKKGFCFIFTGNIGEEYEDTHELQQSFVNRIGDGMIEVPYMPADEIQEIAMLELMNGSLVKGSVTMPDGDFGKLYLFSSAVEYAQDVFSGVIPFTIDDGQGGTVDVREQKLLRKTPFTMRDVKNIIDAYKRSNFAMPFENYIYTSFIKNIQDKTERYIYYKIFESKGFFAQAVDNKAIMNSHGLVQSFTPELERERAPDEDKYHVFTPRDVVDELYNSYSNYYVDVTERDYERDYKKVVYQDSPVLEAGEANKEKLKKQTEEMLAHIGGLRDVANKAHNGFCFIP